jgi:hypothetical protein
MDCNDGNGGLPNQVRGTITCLDISMDPGAFLSLTRVPPRNHSACANIIQKSRTMHMSALGSTHDQKRSDPLTAFHLEIDNGARPHDFRAARYTYRQTSLIQHQFKRVTLSSHCVNRLALRRFFSTQVGTVSVMVTYDSAPTAPFAACVPTTFPRLKPTTLPCGSVAQLMWWGTCWLGDLDRACIRMQRVTDENTSILGPTAHSCQQKASAATIVTDTLKRIYNGNCTR